jgi:NADPH:quinone reductase-like Zn-dependent oxidoreductase
MVKAISIRKVDGKPGKVYYPLEHITIPDTPPKENEVVVKITAAALNHRDLFLRQHLYPGTTFGVPLLADGTGIVTSTGSSPSAKKWQGKRVIINPGSGWKDDPEGPESPKGYSILGGTKMNPLGTLGETVTIDAGELEDAPTHLSSIEAAALPLTGLTAWRATMVKSGNAKPGRNILITGIGGGVAIMALLFAVAAGANVYVSSGSEEKIDRAKTMGAKGGINYKEKGWEKTLKALLPKERQFLDAIIDGAGGDVVEKGARLLKVTFPPNTPNPHETITNTFHSTARRRHLNLRHDHLAHHALPNGRRAQEHRGARLHDGLAQGVCRHGPVRPAEEPEAGCVAVGQWRAGQSRGD